MLVFIINVPSWFQIAYLCISTAWVYYCEQDTCSLFLLYISCSSSVGCNIKPRLRLPQKTKVSLNQPRQKNIRIVIWQDFYLWLSLQLMTIFIWSMKCLIIVANPHHDFPELKMTYIYNCMFCLINSGNPKHIQWIVKKAEVSHKYSHVGAKTSACLVFQLKQHSV